MAASGGPIGRKLALTAFVGFGVSLLAQFAGTKLSTAAAGALITSATPAFIVVFAGLILRERASGRQWFGLAVATTAGVLIVTLVGNQPASVEAADPLLGNFFLILAAVSWALYSVMVKIHTRTYSALAVTLAVTAFGVPIVAPVAAIELQTQTIGVITPSVLAGVLYVGVGCTAIAFFLWNKSFELLDAASVSLFFFAQPVVGTLLSAIFRGQVLGASFFAGGGLILLGALLGHAHEAPSTQVNGS